MASRAALVDGGAEQACAAEARKARLILVEDNEGVRIATELFLKLEGHETLSASSLAEAERLLAQLPCDALIVKALDFEQDLSF